MRGITSLSICYGALLCVLVPAIPFLSSSADGDLKAPWLEERAEPKDFYLRIMPLGASITKGDPAAPGDNEKNGYRKFLRDKLRSEGWQVNMVGSVNDWGTMNDRDNEGYPGEVVSQIHGRAKTALPIFKPNLILINAGTNNGATKELRDAAVGDMERMIMDCFALVPEAVIILSSLLPNSNLKDNPDRPAYIKDINKAYAGLYARLYAQGYHIGWADMDDGFITLGDIHDGTHPTVEGAKKMAAVWRAAIRSTEENKSDWLKKPSDQVKFEDGDGSTTCPKRFASGASDPRGSPQVLFALDPVIKDDGKYIHKSEFQGVIYKSDRGALANYYFAQLVNMGAPRGGELDDLIRVVQDTGSVEFAQNHGDGNFGDFVKIDVKQDCKARGIRWGDINNDGFDDFICVTPNGDLLVSINMKGNPPTFEYLGTHKLPVDGYKQENVRLGDVDGDGRLDYCVIGGDGNVRCWRNGGIGDKAAYWQDLGSGKPVFYAKGKGDIRGVRFADINGDGRADWTWTSTSGKVSTYINQRGVDKGMIPSWQDAGDTHPGQPEFTGETRENIQFARIFGTGRADYVYIKRGQCDSSDPTCDVEMRAWKNIGTGGKFQKGDGVYWGDMTGTGIDDYVWISPEGTLTVFPNRNTPSDLSHYTGSADNSPWGTPFREVLVTNKDRRALHIGDWDGDGKGDVIGVEKISGQVTLWTNQWDGKTLKFSQPATLPTFQCTQGWGIGYSDNGAHVADIDGDGRADLLCMRPSGQTFAWLNKKSSPKPMGQVKFSQDLDRANFRFADVDGDGRADLIHTDKFTGDGRVWINGGEKTEADRERLKGSIFEWFDKGRLYQGWVRGTNEQFPSLQGQRRADLVKLDPTTAKAWVSFNSCPLGGDDVPKGEDVPDPGLPDYNPAPPPGDGGDGNDKDGDTKFCGQNAASWTTDLWDELEMGGWLLSRTQYYSRLEAGWPDLEDRLGGVPRVIAEYNLNDHDRKLNWPGKCLDIDVECELHESDYLTNCRGNWQRAFSLWTMHNYAKLLKYYADQMTSSGLNTSLNLGDMSIKFIAPKRGVGMSTSAWLGLLGGFMTSLASTVPAIASTFGNIASGILTMTSALVGAASAPSDPRVDNWASLASNFSIAQTKAKDVMVGYYNRLLRDMPPTQDEPRGTELARVLMSGIYTNQDLGTGDTKLDEKVMSKAVAAGIINMLWNEQNVFIVQVPKGKLVANADRSPLGDLLKFEYDPCFDKPGLTDNLRAVADTRLWCTSTHNWFILGSGSYFYDYIGTSTDDLGFYGFSREFVIETSRKTQDITQDYKAYNGDAMATYFNDLAHDPTQVKELNDLIRFNIPVCDISNLDIAYEYEECFPEDAGGSRIDRDACFRDIITKTCAKYSTYGKNWIYA